MLNVNLDDNRLWSIKTHGRRGCEEASLSIPFDQKNERRRSLSLIVEEKYLHAIGTATRYLNFLHNDTFTHCQNLNI